MQGVTTQGAGAHGAGVQGACHAGAHGVVWRLRSCRRCTTPSSAAVAETDAPLLVTMPESSAWRLRSWSIRSGTPLTAALAICAAATAATALTDCTASSRSLPTSRDCSVASWIAEAGGASGEKGVWKGVSAGGTGFCARGAGVEGAVGGGSTRGLALALTGGLACCLGFRDWFAATGASAFRGAGAALMPNSWPIEANMRGSYRWWWWWWWRLGHSN